MAKAYYGSRISKNMTQTPEGFLICHNVPIARTGTQKYLAKEIGIEGRDNDIVTVYREENDVFDKRTIASFEGKILTDDHPSGWIDSRNVGNYTKGVISNVRRGTGEEEDLLLADIIVYNKETIDKIQGEGTTQKREVSCGYECDYEQFKNGYKQVDIIGNHVSLVEAGRAGERVAIKDSEEGLILDDERRFTKMTQQYKIPSSKPKSKITDFLKAVGLKAVIQDSEPEDIQNVVDELVEEKYAEREKDEEPVVIEREMEPTEDEDGDSRINALEEKLDSAIEMIQSLMSEEKTEDEDPDEELDALDALEEELGGEPDEIEDEDMMEEEESVTVDPEEMQAEDEDPIMGEEVTSRATDAALKLLRQFKPIIAAMPDKKARKKATDALVKQVRNVAKSTSKTNAYAEMNNRAQNQDAKVVDKGDLGREIAAKFNPHYKK